VDVADVQHSHSFVVRIERREVAGGAVQHHDVADELGQLRPVLAGSAQDALDVADRGRSDRQKARVARLLDRVRIERDGRDGADRHDDHSSGDRSGHDRSDAGRGERGPERAPDRSDDQAAHRHPPQGSPGAIGDVVLERGEHGGVVGDSLGLVQA
jgi:hypothetical protein